MYSLKTVLGPQRYLQRISPKILSRIFQNVLLVLGVQKSYLKKTNLVNSSTFQLIIFDLVFISVKRKYRLDTGRKLNVHKTFNLCPVSRVYNRLKKSISKRLKMVPKCIYYCHQAEHNIVMDCLKRTFRRNMKVWHKVWQIVLLQRRLTPQ